MALDYSKLSDEELNAIANDDYSKLSDATLTAIASESPSATQPKVSEATVNPAPQIASMGARVAGELPAAANPIANAARYVGKNLVDAVANTPVRTAVADVAGVMSHGVPWGSIARAGLDPDAMKVKEAVQSLGNMAKQGAGTLATGARNVGGALLRGAVAPESAVMMPYQMAAYEQEKIRANPNAPGLEYNPYAQVQRGEAPTQRAAGAMNQRMAVANQQYGGLTPQEQSILDRDRLNMAIRLKAAKKVLGQP